MGAALRYYLSIALMDFTSNVLRFTIPLWARDWQAPGRVIGLVGAAQPIAYVLACMVTGRWSDRAGREWMPRLGAGLYIALNLLLPVMGAAGNMGGLGLLNAGVGLLLGLFWPVVEAYLADQVRRGTLVRALGWFNLAWSLGTAGAPVVAGWLYAAMGPPAPFYLAAGTATLVFLCWLKPPTVPPLDSGPKDLPPRQEDFAPVARGVNFLHWLVLSGVITLYPLWAGVLGFDPQRIGRLQGIAHGVRTLVFLGLMIWGGWVYRREGLLLACGVGAVGCLLLAATRSPTWHAGGFAGIGLLGGIAYFSSLLYSLDRPQGRGEGGGWHEAVLGSGAILGPILGGGFADTLGPASPFWASGLLLGSATLLLGALWLPKGGIRKRKKTQRKTSLPPQSTPGKPS